MGNRDAWPVPESPTIVSKPSVKPVTQKGRPCECLVAPRGLLWQRGSKKVPKGGQAEAWTGFRVRGSLLPISYPRVPAFSMRVLGIWG